jgi:hypothetical protein
MEVDPVQLRIGHFQQGQQVARRFGAQFQAQPPRRGREAEVQVARAGGSLEGARAGQRLDLLDAQTPGGVLQDLDMGPKRQRLQVLRDQGRRMRRYPAGTEHQQKPTDEPAHA